MATRDSFAFDLSTQKQPLKPWQVSFLLAQSSKAETLLNQGISKFNQSDDKNYRTLEAALNDFNAAIALNPNYPEAYYWKGLVYAYMRKTTPPENFVCFREETKTKPEIVCRHRLITDWFRENQNLANINFTKAITANPNYGEAYYQRGLLQIDFNPKGTLEDWNKTSYIYLNTGLNQLAQGDYQQSSQYFAQALNMTKQMQDLASQVLGVESPLGYSSLEPLKKKKAQNLYEQANRLLKQGNIEEARQKYQEAALIFQEDKNLQEYGRITQIILKLDEIVAEQPMEGGY